MKELPLYGPRGRGKFALVDDDIFEQYGHLHWHINRNGYVYRWPSTSATCGRSSSCIG